jgi:FAD/FMN-containing dehydrogenase
LVTPGGLYDRMVDVVSCSDESELLSLLEAARKRGTKLAVLGGARSFGGHFLPPDGALALDVSELGRGEARVVEALSDGKIWVRAGGGNRFCDLRRAFPHHRVRCPPTSDRVTLAGAVAACTHNSAGYFCDEVRALRLVTPQGEVLELHPDAEGLCHELFLAVPGALGALGITTQIEILLWPVDEAQRFGVHAAFAGPSRDGQYLAALEAAVDDPRFSEGAGAVVYGNRGHAIVFADEALPLDHVPDKNQALLTDDDIEQQAFTQGFANRFPRLAEWIVSRSYPSGIMRWAPWYGFQFFHRGFDQSFEVLSRRGIKYALGRALGVDAKLPVYHQSWFFHRAHLRAFVNMYFDVLDRYPGIERRVEQQDLVLLPACAWPAHTMSRTDSPLAVLTSSYSVAAIAPTEKERISQFFREVSRVALQSSFDARVSLCKQIHCDREVLTTMHRSFRELIVGLKRRVDPEGMLISEQLRMLL